MGVPVAWVVCGVALLSTSMTRWFRRGPGSRFAGLELADNIRSGVLSPSWGVWVAAGVYALVGLGGGFIATAAVTRPAVLVVRASMATVCLMGFWLLGRVIPPSNWSSGPTIATFVFASAVALSAVQLVNIVRK
ncbi:MAG: hypothetical protein ABJH68_03295 [Ilumatobacter sp.]|uniref:hypothetical protein n=1 Tax=Ilumatobacter sp. TaxID=1967498 RepID=UPI003298B946